MPRLLIPALALLLPLSATAEVPEDSSPELRQVVRAFASDMVRCFGKAHQKKLDARGSVTVAFDISDQQAIATRTVADTVGIPSLSRCMNRRAGKWLYDDVPDGTYTWRFDFRVGTDIRT
ncbi:MAG: hypothetical protein ACJATT_003159 [Myxococcota bacterium]|jgi:hypothetical protein